MRLIDEETNQKLNKAILYFTEEEALELKDSIEDLLMKKTGHHHVSSENFDKEVTITIYNEENLTELDERSKKLVEEDI